MILETTFSGPVKVELIGTIDHYRVMVKVIEDTSVYKKGETIRCYRGQLWSKVKAIGNRWQYSR